MKIYQRVFVLLTLSVLLSTAALAQTSAFTYQGKLTDAGAAANGQYDLLFKLFTDAGGVTQVGGDVVRDNVQVTGGTFTVSLDFGSSPFTASRSTGNFLEISVRPGINTGAYTPLSPRQALTSSPYSISTIRAQSAAVADTANQLGGINASQFVQTGDPRMSDTRTPTANSPNYIQNTSSPQVSSNFNISGTGKSDIFDAGTQFNIGGSRVLGLNVGNRSLYLGRLAGTANTGFDNSFFGQEAGAANADGASNSFYGFDAGFTNISGSSNSFFGRGAGYYNTASSNSFYGANTGSQTTTGTSNSFFGDSAGNNNTDGRDNSFFGKFAGVANISGLNNAFFGSSAGQSNTTGCCNTIIGAFANVASGNLSSATAIGSGAVVSTSNTVVLGTTSDTVRIPGNLNLTGSFTGNLPSGSANYIQNIPGTWPLQGQQTGGFNISGIGTAYIFNVTHSFAINGASVLRATAFGTGSSVSVGALAGPTDGLHNAFFGSMAGSNTSGMANSFFGSQAGLYTETGTSNSFFGASAGQQNTLGSTNSFFGVNAGITNGNGSNNTLIGANADVGSGSLSNATALGFRAQVTQSDSLVLGGINTINGAAADTNVGIGTTAPPALLSVGFTAVNSSANIYQFGFGFTRSDTTFRRAGTLAQSSDSVQPFALYVGAQGAASDTNRVAALQTGVEGSNNSGNLALQPFGGNVGIGTNNPGSTFTVKVGGTTLADFWTTRSSARFKSNIQTIPSALSKLMQLRGVTFDYLDTQKHSIGFVAEEVGRVLPEIVDYEANGLDARGMDYSRVTPLLVEAVKEQQQQIEDQNLTVKQQQAQIESQRKQIDEQRKLIEALRIAVCLQNPNVEICKQKN